MTTFGSLKFNLKTSSFSSQHLFKRRDSDPLWTNVELHVFSDWRKNVLFKFISSSDFISYLLKMQM